MKNSKLTTAGILLLTFLFIHSVQRNIFGSANATSYPLESAANRSFIAFTEGVEQVEEIAFSSILFVINKASQAVSRLVGTEIGPLSLCIQMNAMKKSEPSVLRPELPPVPAGGCHQNMLIDNNPGLVNPRIAGLGIVS